MVHNEGIRHDTTWKISTIDDEDQSLVEETSWVKEDTQKFPNIGWVNIHEKKIPLYAMVAQFCVKMDGFLPWPVGDPDHKIPVNT